MTFEDSCSWKRRTRNGILTGFRDGIRDGLPRSGLPSPQTVICSNTLFYMTAAEKQNQPPARRQEKDRTWQNWLKQESSNHDEKSIAKRDIARDNNGGIWYCISANECTDRPGRVAPVEFATPQPPSIIDSTAFSPTVEDSHETQTYSSRTLVVNRDIPKVSGAALHS